VYLVENVIYQMEFYAFEAELLNV